MTGFGPVTAYTRGSGGSTYVEYLQAQRLIRAFCCSVLDATGTESSALGVGVKVCAERSSHAYALEHNLGKTS